ncbi:hypothetical protein K9N50_07080 [bacterium]|nr:hypothetical protein [bacterium]
MKTVSIYKYISIILIFSVVLVYFLGHTGIGTVKIAGIILATLTVLPVFGLLIKFNKAGNPKLLLGTFVGGFFYKLVVLLVGIWWATSKAGLDTIDFAVSCLTFMIAYQISESLYFWTQKKEDDQNLTS